MRAALVAALALSVLIVGPGTPALAAASTSLTGPETYDVGTPGETAATFTFTADEGEDIRTALVGDPSIYADDVIRVTVLRPDGDTYGDERDYNSNGFCLGVVPQPSFDISHLLAPGRNLVTVSIVDVCGGAASHSAISVTGEGQYTLTSPPSPSECVNGVPGQWQYRSTVSEQDGLVLHDTSLGSRLAVRAMQVAYLKIAMKVDGVEKTYLVRLRADGATQEDGIASTLVPTGSSARAAAVCDERTTAASYRINGLPGGVTVTAEQSYLFQDVKPGDQCEPSGKVPCGRFWPTLTWRTSALTGLKGVSVQSVTTAQRFDFRPDDAPAGSSMLIADEGLQGGKNIAVVGREVVREVRSPAIRNGKDFGTCTKITVTGQYCSIDNYHQSPGSMVSMPGNYGTAGCAECVHMHWRWAVAANLRAAYDEYQRSGAADPRKSLFTSGATAVLPGSRQDAWVSVVAEHLDRDETHPRSVSTLVGDDEMVKGGHPIVYWETKSSGIKQADGSLMDATFPQKVGALPGDRGSLWFNPTPPAHAAMGH